MIAGQRHIDSLIPEMGHVAAIRDWLTCQEGDIQPMPLNRGDVVGWSPFYEVGANLGVRSDIVAEQIGQKARSERRKYSNADNACLTTTERTGIDSRVSNLAQRLARADEESLARLGEMNAAIVTNEERRSDLIFEISDTSADGRLLNPQRLRRASKASALGGRNNVAKMAQFDRQGCYLPWPKLRGPLLLLGGCYDRGVPASSVIEPCKTER